MNPFANLLGQDKAVELLQQAYQLNRIAPGYLFVGTNGVGRSLAAKCFSQLLICAGLSAVRRSSPQEEKHLGISPSAQRSQSLSKCRASQRLLSGNHPDFLWLEPTYLDRGKLLTAKEAEATGLKRKAPPQIRIEQIRILTQFLSRPPYEGSRSVAVIEDAQRMVEAAANALLKTLEEPGRATVILIAPATDSLLPTLVSRCQRIPFSRLAEEDLQQVLRQVGREEIVERPELLAMAEGSPGKAIFAYNQRSAIGEELLEKLIQPPVSPRNALELAQEIDKELDTSAQLWLIDYLQYCYWQKWQAKSLVEQFENARKFLLSYVQPRLTWECTLLSIFQLTR